MIDLGGSTAFWFSIKVITNVSRATIFVLKRFRLKTLALHQEGYYHSNIYRSDTGKVQIADVVKISAGIHHIHITPIWTHGEKNNYTAIAHFNPNNPDYIVGHWEHRNYKKRFGSLTFRLIDKDDRKLINGSYVGVGNSGAIQTSQWYLEKTCNFKEFKYNSWYRKQLRKFRRVKRTGLLDEILRKHSGYFATVSSKREPFEYEGLSFIIPENGFNPSFGKVSGPLLEEALRRENSNVQGKSVLDAGTGCGYYMAAFANLGAKTVFGVDISDDILSTAKKNLQTCGFDDETIHLKKCDLENLFSCFQMDQKFDIIIANLPFTDPRQVKFERTFLELSKNFLGDEKLLFNFLMGCRMHLSDNGKLYMSFGKSGFTQALKEYCNVSGLEITELKELEQRDETFYIYQIQKRHIGAVGI